MTIAKAQALNPYVSPLNQNVPVAHAGEFSALKLGPLTIWPPVVLAPMAGITNSPFRQLCRQFGAGLYVSEMVTARLLVERHPHTVKLASFAPDEQPRSLQLYGVEPGSVGEAAAMLVQEGRVDHIDMNFGCPVRKVTSRGGGSAIPAKPNLLRKIVRACVQNAGEIPVTIKFRIGIDDALQTYLDAGKIAEQEGCVAVALHARTAAQLYTGQADWRAIARLKEAVTTIPVLGNGDIWEARDALRMMRETGCDGVVVGRGCLGRPWLFRDLADVFAGREQQPPPALGEIADIILEHARLTCEWFDEPAAMRMFRKHLTWYVKGFRSARPIYRSLVTVDSLAELQALLRSINPDEPFPLQQLRARRGKNRCKQQKVALPAGYLDDPEDDTPPGWEADVAGLGG